MSLTERIVEAGNSPEILIKKFEDALLITNKAEVFDSGTGQSLGESQIRRLPYGCGEMARISGKAIWVDNVGGEWHTDHRIKFRYVNFPITCKFMD